MYDSLKTTKQKVHFLHIGKTGGSAIKSVLKENLETPKYILKLYGHKTSLRDIPKGEYVVFFLRDPISRFVSGFYSRQRKGQPLYYAQWSSLEKKVFETFKTPNQLACALADDMSKEHLLAIEAMKNILHFLHYHNWYGGFEYFKSRIDDICYIGFQESLDTNFSELKNILEIPETASLPTDDVLAHKNPKGLDKSIDECGVAALKEWYSEDIEFVLLCKEIMSF